MKVPGTLTFLLFLKLVKNNYPYVKHADGTKVVIMTATGFSKICGYRFVFETKNDTEKAQLFSWLRDQGVYFSHGREWSPEEVFEYLRDKKLVQGNFNVIAWKGPKEFRVYQR